MKWPPPTTGYWRLQQNRRTVMQSAIVIHTPCTVNLSTGDLSRHKSTAEYSRICTMITHTGQSLIPIFPHLSLSSARWSIYSSCFPLTGMSKSLRTVSQMSKSLFRYLRTLTTWYCPHSSAARRCCRNRSSSPAYRAQSSKPAARC